MTKISNELKIQIGKRIKTARKDSGYTQEELADLIGIEPQSLSDIERGKYCASVPNLIQFSEILHVSCDYLLTGRSISSSKIPENVRYWERLSPGDQNLMEQMIRLVLKIMNEK
ncbi:MAG: helix-turn-helix transcriptional regulator [Parasporobacterium sp.]|nr:helix-turn-helix transcriptional regulator [Parasporobacterium sp.]